MKAEIGRWSLRECQDLATDVLRSRTTSEVRALLREAVETAGASAPRKALS